MLATPWTPPSSISIALALTSPHWSQPYSSSFSSAFSTSPLLHRQSSSSLITTATATAPPATSSPLNPLRRMNPNTLGNGCFGYGQSTDSSQSGLPPNHNPWPQRQQQQQQTARPVRSRMETHYLQPRTLTLPTPEPTTAQIHQDQNHQGIDDCSPGWKLRLIKKTPHRHAANSIWAKYPSLQEQLPSLWDSITPWWFAGSVASFSSSVYSSSGTTSSYSSSSYSSSSVLNLIPCDTDLTSTSGTSSSFCSSTLPYLHEYEYNNSKVEVENGLTVYGYISALAAKSRSDAISADPIFQHGLFAIRTSERLQDSRRQQGQQTPESPVETCKGNMATTSMELVDSKGASSPTFQTLTSSGNTSTTIPNNSCNKPDLLKIVPRRNPHACPTTIDTFVPGLTNPATNADPNHINFNESVAAAAEAMDRIRERVAAKEVEVQLEYLGRSSLLLQMLLRDKGKVCSTNNHSIRVGGVEDRSNDGDTSSDMETDGSVGSFSSLYDFESIDDRELFVL